MNGNVRARDQGRIFMRIRRKENEMQKMPVYDSDFDGQRLIFHPTAVAHWLRKGVTAGPLYAEVDLINRCNCNCVFCGVDFRVNKGTKTVMETPLAARLVRGLAKLGCRAVMFSGDGEPLMNPDAGKIIKDASGVLGVSLTTNGTLLNDRNAGMLDGLRWLRFSINGYDRASYAAVHRCSPEMFDRAIGGVRAAVERKRKKRLPVTIGVQMTLLDMNAGGALELARVVRRIGADYFSVKPYSRHPKCLNRVRVSYNRYLGLGDELGRLDTDAFKTIFRAESFLKAGSRKPYTRCYGAGFMCFVASDGNVYQCNVFAGDRRFLIGNIRDTDIADIWKSERRRKVVAGIERMRMDGCRDICRMDACNRYLWRLKHPLAHDDFV